MPIWNAGKHQFYSNDKRDHHVTTHLGSEISLPIVLSSPKLWAAMAAAAMVFTLFGAKKQRGLTIQENI